MTDAGRDGVLSRRWFLAGAAGAAATGTLGLPGVAGGWRFPGFRGARQDGIVGPPPPHLAIAGFDLLTPDRRELVRVLREWSRIAAGLTGSGPGSRRDEGTATAGRRDVTVTIGFGPSLFAGDRYAIADRRPAPLVEIPAFAGDAIDPAASGGDLCVQACATDPGTAHQAIRTLLTAARPHVILRWRQSGFQPDDSARDPRGLFGFRDGTSNLDVDDPRETGRHLWVSDGPAWMHGGTFMVVRRIRMLLETWDRVTVAQQETIIGRRRASNRRVDAVPDAHANLASSARNEGIKLLRRSYTYHAGIDPDGLMDSGLIFISFQRDPQQFVAIQQRLARHDPLNTFSQHVASGVFACPPGHPQGSWLGAELFS
jgi:deferrochelatase/peroxidase EfeB